MADLRDDDETTPTQPAEPPPSAPMPVTLHAPGTAPGDPGPEEDSGVKPAVALSVRQLRELTEKASADANKVLTKQLSYVERKMKKSGRWRTLALFVGTAAGQAVATYVVARAQSQAARQVEAAVAPVVAALDGGAR